MKLCTKCKTTKILSCFPKSKKEKSGYGSWCNNCMSEHYQRNREKYAKRNKEYRDKNSQALAQSRKLYYQKNKEKLLEKQRAYYHRTKSARKSAQRSWYLCNKSVQREISLRYRSNKRKATPPWLTRADKNEIRELYQVCEMFRIYTGLDYHVDHIIPLAGDNVCGLHVPWNLQVLTSAENQSKSNKVEESWH